VLAALETYAREVVPGLASHALCGKPTLSVGTIAGGISVNTVPDRCTIEIDRRVLPGEQPSQARQHVIDYLRDVRGLDFALEHDAPFSQGMPLAETGNGPLADRLSAVAKGLAGTGKLIGVPYGTDAPSIAAAGIPAVVFGPGSIDSAHTIDESVPLDEVAAASEILYELAAYWNDKARA
jgi:acetylornithine deacetylase